MAKNPKPYDSASHWPGGKAVKLPKTWEESGVKSALDKLADVMVDIVAKEVASEYTKAFEKLLQPMPLYVEPAPVKIDQQGLFPPLAKFRGVFDTLPINGKDGSFQPGDYVTLASPVRDYILGYNGNWYLWADPPMVELPEDSAVHDPGKEETADKAIALKMMKHAQAYGKLDSVSLKTMAEKFTAKSLGFKKPAFGSLAKFTDFLQALGINHPHIKFEADYDHSMQKYAVAATIPINTMGDLYKTMAAFPADVGEQTVVKWAAGAILELEANEGAKKMALLLKGFNGIATMKKVGVPASLFDWFVKHQGASDYINGEVVLTVPAGPIAVSVPMTIAHVQQANLGTLPTHVKSTYQQKFKHALMVLKNKFEVSSASPSQAKMEPTFYGLPPVVIAEQNKTVEELYSVLKPTLEAAPIKYGKPPKYPPFDSGDAKLVEIVSGKDWQLFPLAELKTAPLAKLSDADRMYQPVQATTPMKRYYVVALNKLFRVAVAYNKPELSVRIEWTPETGLGDINEAIQAVFPNASAGKGYGSLHLAISEDTLASKTLGAVLMGCGVPWETPLPNLDVIKGL